jgi:hypothetical protein
MPLIKLNATQGLTGTLPAVSGANLTNIDGGKVLQVVQTTSNTGIETTSETFQDIISLNITPSATSSKVLILITHPFRKVNSDASNTSIGLRILKDGSSIIDWGNYMAWNNNQAQYNQETASINFLNSPSTTSQVTYKSQFKTQHASGRVSVNHDSSYSSMTLMEIAV